MKTVIEMAREAGWKDLRDYDSEMRHEFFMGNTDSIKRLVDLARADEREACASECDEWIKNGSALAEDIAAAIRARGQHGT